MDIPDGSIKFAHGWLYEFQQRHRLRAVRGESGSADVAGLEAALQELQAAVSKFAPRDVHNTDETGKFS
uniref:HTH CENPB-type domain-containing protein n=1 Tax=Peronospora matthiolae TaxID=2874970 RepID=A0AAV1U8Y9_9STRA